MGVLDKAKRQARKAIESMYDGVCTISNYQNIEDPITFVTELKEVEVIKDQPCRLSYSSLPVTNQTDSFAGVNQSIKLFIAPEVNIPAGSKIVVTQNGRTTVYKNSGQPAIYSTHQEIFLELFEDKA